MYNIKIDFLNKNGKILIFFIHGYKADKEEMVFLVRHLSLRKDISIASVFYKLENSFGKKYSIKNIDLNLEKELFRLIVSYKFKKIFVVGYSLGAAIALEIVARNLVKIDKLVLISIFDNRKKLLKGKNIKIGEKENLVPINSIKKVEKIKILFIHGTKDESINLFMGKVVFEKSDRKHSKFAEINSDHYFKSTDSKQALLKEIDKFLFKR